MLLSNYERCLYYEQPLLTLHSILQTDPYSPRFTFSFPPPCEIPFVCKSLDGGMTLHIETAPSVDLMNDFIEFTTSLPIELSLYPGFDRADWIKMFSTPTFFVYIEKDGTILSLMSLAKLVSTKDDVIFNILTTQANNKRATAMLDTLPPKGLGDIMFTQVHA